MSTSTTDFSIIEKIKCEQYVNELAPVIHSSKANRLVLLEVGFVSAAMALEILETAAKLHESK
ncbi:MAG: hypothetical protein D4R94_07225 [Chitinophagaceae bacterium]|nr:MAG: hypothetical protein D4R94_07225 [Chitinophagaceae bacterium]